MTKLQEQLISIVKEVPEWFLVSYGVVAKELMKRSERTITAKLIGRQLSGMPEHDWSQLPWWRVVNKQWYVSSLKLWVKWLKQIVLLEKEWYTVTNGYIQEPEWWGFDGR